MSTASSTAVGAGSGAASGAAIGTTIMPGYGTAIGAGVGAVVGGVTGYFKGSSEEEARKRKQRAWERTQKLLAAARVQRDQQQQALMRDVFTPVNNTMMGMYGSGAGVDMAGMTRGATPKPQAQKPQQQVSYAPQPKGR